MHAVPAHALLPATHLLNGCQGVPDGVSDRFVSGCALEGNDHALPRTAPGFWQLLGQQIPDVIQLRLDLPETSILSSRLTARQC